MESASTAKKVYCYCLHCSSINPKRITWSNYARHIQNFHCERYQQLKSINGKRKDKESKIFVDYVLEEDVECVDVDSQLYKLRDEDDLSKYKSFLRDGIGTGEPSKSKKIVSSNQVKAQSKFEISRSKIKPKLWIYMKQKAIQKSRIKRKAYIQKLRDSIATLHARCEDLEIENKRLRQTKTKQQKQQKGRQQPIQKAKSHKLQAKRKLKKFVAERDQSEESDNQSDFISTSIPKRSIQEDSVDSESESMSSQTNMENQQMHSQAESNSTSEDEDEVDFGIHSEVDCVITPQKIQPAKNSKQDHGSQSVKSNSCSWIDNAKVLNLRLNSESNLSYIGVGRQDLLNNNITASYFQYYNQMNQIIKQGILSFKDDEDDYVKTLAKFLNLLGFENIQIMYVQTTKEIVFQMNDTQNDQSYSWLKLYLGQHAKNRANHEFNLLKDHKDAKFILPCQNLFFDSDESLFIQSFRINQKFYPLGKFLMNATKLKHVYRLRIAIGVCIANLELMQRGIFAPHQNIMRYLVGPSSFNMKVLIAGLDYAFKKDRLFKPWSGFSVVSNEVQQAARDDKAIHQSNEYLNKPIAFILYLVLKPGQNKLILKVCKDEFLSDEEKAAPAYGNQFKGYGQVQRLWSGKITIKDVANELLGMIEADYPRHIMHLKDEIAFLNNCQ